MKTTNDIVKNALEHAVANEKFDVGEKVIVPSRPSLGVCTIEKVVKSGMYGTLYYIKTSVGLQPEYEQNMKSANSIVANAKFKVGDKIKYGKLMCVVRKVDESAKMYDVDIDMPSGNKVPMRSEISEIDKYSVKNAKFKVGDFVFDRNTHRSGTIEKDADKPLVGIKDDFTGKVVFIKSDNLEVRNAVPMSAHEASVILSGKRKAVTQYAKVEPNTLYYRALGGIFAVPDSETMKSAIEAIGSRVLPYQVGSVVGNSKS